MAEYVPLLLGCNLIPGSSLRTGQDIELELAWVFQQHQELGVGVHDSGHRRKLGFLVLTFHSK